MGSETKTVKNIYKVVNQDNIIPRIIHSSNVDHNTKNLRYFGDIVIKGNVNAGTIVEARDDIMIDGNVNQSTIMAGSRIIVGQNVINSNVSSGKVNLTIREIDALLKKLSTNIHLVAMAVEQVYQSPIFKTTDIAKMGLSSLIRILLEKNSKILLL